MALKIKFNIIFFILAISLNSFAAETTISGELKSIQEEIARLGFVVSCNKENNNCTIINDQTITIEIRKNSSTIYMFIDNIYALPDTDNLSSKLAKEIVRLNTKLIASRIEWDETKNSLRLSAVIHTDSNFDRKAFRSVLLGLIETSKIVKKSLEKK